jgi:ABC-2 type transport system permease protein
MNDSSAISQLTLFLQSSASPLVPSTRSFDMQVAQFAFMVIVDLIFVVALVLLMLPVGIWRQAAFAVMKRNFIGYFSNPTGYVFLCLFVLLTSFAAFWPHEFFTTNLANFDQLNKFLPYIMLIFIPAITMSIWAEERRQGTDELLLTLPAKDFDIVIGKYFAAVLVFTVSLFLSQLSNYAVLLSMTGGSLDNLLLFSTYLGYWFMGIAMISLGMVASFLTNNLTVGFIFGAAFNAPLAFFSNADLILSSSKWIQRLFEWSLLQRFEPFGRGLVSASSILYFLGIVVIGVYLSLILIGRRHWLGGRDGTSMFWHYILRAGFVGVIAVGLVLIVQHSPLNRVRRDISEAQVSTLSTTTKKILTDLAEDTGPSKQPIKIEAYVSSSVPSEFVKLRYDLVNLLREFDVLGGNRIQVTLHQGMEPFSEEAIVAEKKYGIRPTRVQSQSRGAMREEEIMLGVAFSSGKERIILPFLPYGTPVEYELIRSINTIAQGNRKTLGILRSDAFIEGAVVSDGKNPVTLPTLRILPELRKQYNIELVDASTPIQVFLDKDDQHESRFRYDVLLVAQPSKLSPVELDNLINAIQLGQPTAIFEDPFPNPENYRHFLGTFLPRTLDRLTRETADIQKLFTALEIDVDFQSIAVEGRTIRFPFVVWQLAENPYPRDNRLNQPELVIISDRTRETNFSSSHPAMTGIEQLFFQFTGYLAPRPKTKLDYHPLVTTSQAGRIALAELMSAQSPQELNRLRGSPNRSFDLAAHIKGASANAPIPAKGSDRTPEPGFTNVIYVADVDMLADYFVNIRNFPIQNGIEYRFQNMAFVLNLVDSLAGETNYFELRNRRVNHSTLRVVEEAAEKAMQKKHDTSQTLQIEFETEQAKIESEKNLKIKPIQERIDREIQAKTAGEAYDQQRLAALEAQKATVEREQEVKFRSRLEAAQNDLRENERRADLDAELEIQQIQRQFKLAAVILPPILPLLVGLIVFTRRRLREREGISKSRRLK